MQPGFFTPQNAYGILDALDDAKGELVNESIYH